ncbi:MAG: methylamine utilization protein [Planctomycetota bacterium]|nr:MAG: methylamine utilization protein [Planctomycetota bacterium]
MYLWAHRLCRWCVAAVLLAAAVAKWFDLASFARAVGDFGLVWDGWEHPTAIAVSVLEAVAAALLFAGRRTGYGLAAALLLAFTAVVGYGVWQGFDIDCGCLGAVDRWAGVTLKTSLVRNLVLLAILAVAWRTRRAGG